MTFRLFFGADDGFGGFEPFVTDGTGAGTVRLRDINPGLPDSLGLFLPAQLGPVPFILFGADDGVNGFELYTTDGTQTGTRLVRDLNPGPSGSSPQDFTYHTGLVYFAADDADTGSGTGHELYVSDGTAAGTRRLADINPGSGDANPLNLTIFGDKLLFSAEDGLSGRELYSYDTITQTTTRLADINPGSADANPGTDKDAILGGQMFFDANDGTNGKELWVTDGTPAGTRLVEDINSGGSSNPSFFKPFNDLMYFIATDAAMGRELWQSDGTSGGTRRVADINPGIADSFPREQTVVGNRMLFSADDGATGRELWSVNASGIVSRLADINAGALSSNPGGLTPFGSAGQAIFAADNGSSGREVWITDGTSGGTTLLADINPIGGSNPSNFTVMEGFVYFSADNGTTGQELWRTDGTTVGTTFVADINFGGLGSNLGQFVVLDINGAPEIPLLTNNSVAESAGDGTQVGIVTTTDPDGDDLIFSLTDDAAGLFRIGSTGVIRVNGALDYETAISHSITVQVADPDGLTSVATFEILVTDVDERGAAPVIGRLSNSRVLENASIGTSIGILSARDAENETLTFALTDDAGGLFTINSATGEVRLNGALDYETAQFHPISVSVSDTSGNTTTGSVNINVGNVNEAPDLGTLSNLGISQFSASGTQVGVVAATDPEGNRLTYSLTDTAGDLFRISATGVLRLNGTLDFNRASSHDITVQVRDGGGNTDTGTLTIDVTQFDSSVLGGAGRDRLIGTPGADLIRGGGGEDNLRGNAGADDMNGGDGNDVLQGGAGADVMVGGLGNDRLIGGAGNDVMYGGHGRDKFTLTLGMGHDVILDFERGRDSIVYAGTAAEGAVVTQTITGHRMITLADGSSVTIREDNKFEAATQTPRPAETLTLTSVGDVDDGDRLWAAGQRPAELTENRMKVGETFWGQTEASGDLDWVAVSLTAGQRISALMRDIKTVGSDETAPGASAQFAKGIILLDEAGRVLDQGDGSFWSGAWFIHEAETTGTYYIGVAKAAQSAMSTVPVTGPYSLTVRDATFDENAVATQITEGFWDVVNQRTRAFDISDNKVITVDITQLNAGGQKLATIALEAWAAVSGLAFRHTTRGDRADIYFDDEKLNETSASLTRDVNEIKHVFVQIDKRDLRITDIVGDERGAPTDDINSATYQTYLHEIGHALGLGHGGFYDSSNKPYDPNGSDNYYRNDSWQETVMSYYNQAENTTVNATLGLNITPTIADIIAIQSLYPTATPVNNPTNTVYDLKGAGTPVDFDLAALGTGFAGVSLPVGAKNNWVSTLFDTGGSDTFDASAYRGKRPIKFDLNDESRSDIGKFIGDISIARGTFIENYVGGPKRDHVTGNELANQIVGKGGQDRLFGGRGNDALSGGGGKDTLDGGIGSDVLTGGAGGDVFVFSNQGPSGQQNTVSDFADDIDTIQLDASLWPGTLSVGRVVKRYASVDGGDVVLSFNKIEIRIEGLTELSELRNDLVIV